MVQIPGWAVTGHRPPRPLAWRAMPTIHRQDLQRIAGRQIDHVADFETEVDDAAGWRFDRPVLLSDGRMLTGRVAVVLYEDEVSWLGSNCDFGATRLAAATWLIRRQPLDHGSLFVVEDGLLDVKEMRVAHQRWDAAIKRLTKRS